VHVSGRCKEGERVTAARTCDRTLNQIVGPEQFRSAHFRRMGVRNRPIPTVRLRSVPQYTVWTAIALIDLSSGGPILQSESYAVKIAAVPDLQVPGITALIYDVLLRFNSPMWLIPTS
jgi:hypothetical protein